MNAKLLAFVIYTVAVAALSWAGCHYYEKPRTVTVVAHAQSTEVDGSVIAARVAAPVMPTVEIPQGSHATATARITLKPRAPAAPVGQVVPKDCAQLTCPAVTLDVATTRTADGQNDLITHAAGADVDSATFTPTTQEMPATHFNAAGAMYLDGRWGAIYERDFQGLPVRVGAFALKGDARDHWPVVPGLNVEVRW